MLSSYLLFDDNLVGTFFCLLNNIIFGLNDVTSAVISVKQLETIVSFWQAAVKIYALTQQTSQSFGVLPWLRLSYIRIGLIKAYVLPGT